MCSNYSPTTARKRLEQFFGVQMDLDFSTIKHHVWKGYAAPFIRSRLTPERENKRKLSIGEFGLLPAWSKIRTIKYSTFNARSETADTTASYRGAWKAGQRCIIPADSIVEPDWRSGKHIPTRIGRINGAPMGIAGLWDKWTDKATGEIVFSFTMLTVNADGHALMANFHKPNDEKRMVVILPEDQYEDWLTAPVNQTRAFLQRYPAEKLTVETGIAPGEN